MCMISRVYIFTGYVLDRLADMTHLLGSKEVTTGRQVDRLELERKDEFFFLPENSYLNFPVSASESGICGFHVCISLILSFLGS